MPFTPTNVGDVTPRTGRDIWNANDQGIAGVANAAEAGVTTVNNNLNTHKTSDDHDGRYYTEAEVDAALATRDNNLNTHKTSGDHDGRYFLLSNLSTLVQTTLNQVIDGVKTYLQNLVVKKITPAIELQHTDGTPLAKIYGSSTPEAMMRLEVGTTVVLDALEGNASVNFPNHDVKSRGVQLATVLDVANAIRSGSAYLSGQTLLLGPGSPNGNEGYTKIGSDDQVFAIPSGRRITQVDVVPVEVDNDVAGTFSRSLVLNERVVKVHVSYNSGLFIVSLRDQRGATLWEQQHTGAPTNDAARYHVTLKVSV